MYRDLSEPPEQSSEPPAPARRKFAPVPLSLVGGMMALAAEFFGMFLLAWGMAPTSVGCGAERAVSISAAMIPVSLAVYAAFTGVGIGIMRDARESQLRRRSFLWIFTAIYVLGSIPLFAFAALAGSCFDF